VDLYLFDSDITMCALISHNPPPDAYRAMLDHFGAIDAFARRNGSQN
jgi:hypothetical protein